LGILILIIIPAWAAVRLFILPARLIHTAGVNPSADLTFEEYSMIARYFESGNYKLFSDDEDIEEICKIATHRIRYHNRDLYILVLERYKDDPKRWHALVPISTEAINEFDTGSDFILAECRAATHKPPIDKLDLHGFVSNDVDIRMLVALLMSYEPHDLKPHAEVLKIVLDRNDLSDEFQELIQEKLEVRSVQDHILSQ